MEAFQQWPSARRAIVESALAMPERETVEVVGEDVGVEEGGAGSSSPDKMELRDYEDVIVDDKKQLRSTDLKSRKYWDLVLASVTNIFKMAICWNVMSEF